MKVFSFLSLIRPIRNPKMRIKDLAAQTGHTPETIRYYERIGLLDAPRREINNYRSYDDSHVQRLNFIKHCRSLDIGLDEIRSLILAMNSNNTAGAAAAHKLVQQHIDRVESKIRNLNELKNELRRLSDETCCDHVSGKCGIIEELNN